MGGEKKEKTWRMIQLIFVSYFHFCIHLSVLSESQQKQKYVKKKIFLRNGKEVDEEEKNLCTLPLFFPLQKLE